MNQTERLDAKIKRLQSQIDAKKIERKNNCYCPTGKCNKQPGAICRMTGKP